MNQVDGMNSCKQCYSFTLSHSGNLGLEIEKVNIIKEQGSDIFDMI